MKYILNNGTGKLHIEGYCCHTNPMPSEYLEFETENDARCHTGGNLTWCKICERKKEQKLKEK